MKGSRTVIFNVIMAIILGAKQFGVETDVDAATINQGLDALDKLLLLGTTIGNVILRFFTSTKIFNKE